MPSGRRTRPPAPSLPTRTRPETYDDDIPESEPHQGAGAGSEDQTVSEARTDHITELPIDDGSFVSSDANPLIDDNTDILDFAFLWLRDPESAAKHLSENLCIFQIPDFQFLLEAMRCESDGKPRLCLVLSQLYLLVRRFQSLPEEEKEGFLDNMVNVDLQNKDSPMFRQLVSTVQLFVTRKTAHDISPSVERLNVSMDAVQLHRRRSSHHTSSLPNVEEEESPGMGIRRGSRSDITTPLAAGYYVRSSKFFSLGRVFIMLWHENATAANRYLRDSGTTVPGLHGEKVFSHIRRFVVVHKGHGFSWAIPINTYQGKGLLRGGFDQDEIDAHAIIHMEGTNPQPIAGEPRMTKTPIIVDNTTKDKKLEPSSRIRFDKVFTIEHNVKTRNVGKISRKSLPYFWTYWRAEAQKAIPIAGPAGPASPVT
ncbi:uncharacterized protein Z518_05400 [Rhinocladiella mackenziei CBS 650.93]|uniref:DUF6590 domain-containing protein n=1 Tax=Rhinocladiella mackenziei CBS 650.93 TaxID=1442369 RepID=A0A0D2J679_9EURO|nr:uncharacterized protein Z518_05400 [Rhinocladiella mackenziei CBS 650.93]KIX04530.1 hypothetical protein Z518_05400 [Rhinocladiella mackenziei CBS 650.93]